MTQATLAGGAPTRPRRPNVTLRDFEAYADGMRAFFDDFAPKRSCWRPRGYHGLIRDCFRFYIPPGARVLEIGCGTGDLLAELEPSFGLGIDISPGMVEQARQRHPSPDLQFQVMAAEQLEIDEGPFDFIVLSDTLSYLYDIQTVLRRISSLCQPQTRLICNFFSRLWQPTLAVLERIGLKYPQPLLNWVAPGDVANLLRISGFDLIQHDLRILFPARVPLLSGMLNRGLASLPGIRHFCLTNWMVARVPRQTASQAGVSVICPCRNERGNIERIVERFPDFGSDSELIFVEGNSSDGTFEECQRVAESNSNLDISVYRQTGRGKGDAVRLGFDRARHEILVILDADMTVWPEDLPRFVEILREGRGELINGSRLVYAMDDKAMRFLNLLGNKFFSVVLSFLLGQPVKDTLCGTKVLLKSDYERLKAQRDYFGEFDPFGDFDLLFGAAKMCLKIVDFPVRYRERTWGTTQISRFRHGWMLFKMSAVGMLKLRCR